MHRCLTACGFAGWLLVTAVVTASLGLAAAGKPAKSVPSKMPSSGSIIAALARQANATIECSYRIITPGGQHIAFADSNMAATVPSGGTAPMMYIRTRDVLYAKASLSASSPYSEMATERKGLTGLGDLYVKVTYPGGGWQGGRSSVAAISAWAERRFARPETGLYPLPARPDDPSTCFLVGWLRYGKVTPKPEMVDGHPCWKMVVTETGSSAVKIIEIWLDQSIGFCPRRIVLRSRAGGAKPRVVRFEDYIALRLGVWFPRRVTDSAQGVQGAVVYAVDRVTNQKTYVKTDLMPSYPPQARLDGAQH